MADFLVLPGFVDSHRHTWQSPIRHTGIGLGPAAHVRRAVQALRTEFPARGRLRGDPVRAPGRARCRRHHAARLGAHPEFARPCRRGGAGAARGRRAHGLCPRPARCRAGALDEGQHPATPSRHPPPARTRAHQRRRAGDARHGGARARVHHHRNRRARPAARPRARLAHHHPHRSRRQRAEVSRHRAHARAPSARAGRHLRPLLQFERPRIPPDGGDRHDGLRVGPDRHVVRAASACRPPAGCWRTACVPA